MTASAPRVSVVVRSYGRLHALAELLDRLLTQEHDAFEVVVEFVGAPYLLKASSNVEYKTWMVKLQHQVTTAVITERLTKHTAQPTLTFCSHTWCNVASEPACCLKTLKQRRWSWRSNARKRSSVKS